jgi:polar amino acid transport system substrate-binding protein
VNVKLAGELPAAVKHKGTLVVATDASYAPNEFIAAHTHTIVGMDPDLARALGRVMGLRVKIVNVSFNKIIPRLISHRYDLGMSSFTDTKQREHVVDFVTYYSAGTAFLVNAHGGPTVHRLADLCGHTVAVANRSPQQADAVAQNATCKAAGKPAVTVESIPDQHRANHALSSGRAEIAMLDSPIAEYLAAKSNGRLKLSGKPYATAPYGIAIAKHSHIAKAIRDALTILIHNRKYLAILKKWGIQKGAITHPKINAAT